MQSNEFDTYLSLLGKLLRLTDAQRKGLTDELRDHLESRTEDLVAAGVSPEAAIHQALDELGDVAGLAHQFLFVSRLQKRRRIMKWSLGTVAVVGTIFCLLTFGRNDRPGAPNGSPLIAQEAAEKTKTADESPSSNPGPKASPAKKATSSPISVDQQSTRIEWALNGPTMFEFQGVTLGEFADYIREFHKIEVDIDMASLQDEGIAVETPITKRMHNVRLRTALDLLLRDHKLGYQNYDGVLLITTEAKAKQNLTRRVYPRKGTFAQIEARQVYSLLVTSIYPETWRPEGGRGALNILPDRIIVSNTDAVHRELELFWKQNDEIASSSEAKMKNDTFTEGDVSANQQAGGGLF